MKHKITIWSKNKKTGKEFRVETHVELTREDIENLAVKKYKSDYSLEQNRIYFAELDETII